MAIDEYRALWEHLNTLCLNLNYLQPFELDNLALEITTDGLKDLDEPIDGDLADEYKVYEFDKVPLNIIHDLYCILGEHLDYLTEARGILFSLVKMAEVREGPIK